MKTGKKIIRYIHQATQENGFPPTIREIGAAVGLSSPSTIHGHLSRMQKKGFLYRDPTKPRTIELTKKGKEWAGITDTLVPMLGVVAAGEPILAVENPSDYFPLPPDLNVGGEIFMLIIKGNSMINIGILDGDQVFVKKQSTAENGDIVIAMNEEGEATCKTFYREKKNLIRLQPENDELSPIFLKNCVILGKVIGLYRNLL